MPFLGQLSPFPRADRWKSAQGWADPSLQLGISLCPSTHSDLGPAPPEFSRSDLSSPSTSRHLAEQDYPSLRHSLSPGSQNSGNFFPPKHLPLREAGHHFHFSLCFPRGGNALVNNSRIPEGQQSCSGLTGHKTPHLFVPGWTSQIYEPGAAGTDPEGKQGKKKGEYFL